MERRLPGLLRLSDRERVVSGVVSRPPTLESAARRSGVVDGVLGIPVAEIVLNEPQIVAGLAPYLTRTAAKRPGASFV